MCLLDGTRTANHHRHVEAPGEQAALGAIRDLDVLCARLGKRVQQAHRLNAWMGLQRRVFVHDLDLDVCHTRQLSRFTYQHLGTLAQLLQQRIGVVARQVAVFEFQGAQVGHDVQRLAAIDTADVYGAVRDVVTLVTRALLFDLLLALAQFGDEVAGQVNRVDRSWGQRGMRLLTSTEGAIGRLALVTDGELHQGRLADHAQERTYRCQMQDIEQPPHADAADLFVMGQRQLQRARQGHVRSIEHRVDSQGDKALHVAGATAVDAPVTQGRLKRWHRPRLTGRRNHVGVAGQQHARHFPRAGAGEQVGFLAGLVLDDQRLDAFAGQQFADVFDQRHVRLRRHGVEGDQTLEDFQCAGAHEALLVCSVRLSARLTSKRRMSNGLIEVLVVPVLISSAITSPTPGPSWKPWPQKPNA